MKSLGPTAWMTSIMKTKIVFALFFVAWNMSSMSLYALDIHPAPFYNSVVQSELWCVND